MNIEASLKQLEQEINQEKNALKGERSGDNHNKRHPFH